MRRLTVLIAFVLLVFALPVCAANENAVFFAGFESGGELSLWDGGSLIDDTFTEGKHACAVNNAYGEEVNGKVSHVLFSLKAVSLKPGEIYRISFDAMNLAGDSFADVGSSTHFGDGTNSIVFEFNGISDDWTPVTAFFMVPREGDYGFLLELKNGDRDLGFFIDNLEIMRVDITPDNLTIDGPRELKIPVMGERSVRYSVECLTAEGESVSVLSEMALSAENLPAGVDFDAVSGTVTVSEGCPNGSSFLLVCTPPDFLNFSAVYIEVRLTKNILKNSDFSEGGEYWEVENGFELGSGVFGNYITLFTEYPTMYGYSTTIRPSEPVFLREGLMYVFRASVRVESGSSSSAYSQNTAVSRDGEVEINIIDLSAGDWTEVFAAFTPEFSGVYNLNLSFTTLEEGIVSVGNMTLAPEPQEETFLTLHAPGNIAVPDTTTVYPLNAYIRDQAGEILSSRCTLSLYPEESGVELVDGGISVSPGAKTGEYEIYAVSRSNPSLEKSLFFTVSNDNVADGGFEEYGMNYRWAAAAPASLRVVENLDGKCARIISDDDFAIIINNSYMHLYANVPYAFKADILGGRGATVTAFIETVDGERIPVVQSSSGSDIFELFQPENDMIGRLMLYISSEDAGVDLWLDNVELFRSIVTAAAPMARGLAESGATLTAEFDFFNNMDPTNDPSACVISWYGMSASGGDPVYVGSGKTFVVRADLVGRYVYFEVTPVCAITGLSGLPAQSIPLAIGELKMDDGFIEPPLTADDVEEKPRFSPVELAQEASAQPFSDLGGHWAENCVAALYGCGVINGKTEKSFCPDELVTRAELAAMLWRAFGVEEGEEPKEFSDVSPEAWYAKGVAALSSTGIINGTGEGRFSPEKTVNREELTAMLVRLFAAMGGESAPSSLDRFYDHGDISVWAEDDVAVGLKIGLVNGTEQSTFAPKRAATRAEACAMIYRLLKIIGEN